jgi:hypothetical protein
MDNEKSFFKTSDLNLAAALLSCGHDVVGINPTDSNRVVFFFDDTKELRATYDSYWNNGLRISPKDYMYNRKELLTRVNRSDIVNGKEY